MLIILDLDGTLINSQKQHLNSFIKAFTKAGYYVSKEMRDEIKTKFGRPSREIIRELLPNINDLMVKTIGQSILQVLLKEEFDNVTLIPGAEEFLKDNWQNNELILATSADKEFAYKILDKFNIRQYFRRVITNDDISRPKPNPEIVLKALELSGYSRNDAVFIGDTIYDYETAKNAGVKFIGVLSNSLYPDKLIKA
ncbi:hypothetical protein COZ55_00340, partial [archaeon CG_4_8_14_3_um_filter_38_5]